MKNHCVSLELAKKLKEAGWKKPTTFYWVKEYTTIPDNTEWNLKTKEWLEGSDVNGEDNYDYWENDLGKFIYPAPLATEILEELPAGVELMNLGNKGYSAQDYSIGHSHEIINLNPCDALALMWLY